MVSLVCDDGIFKPSDGFSSAWPFMIQSMGRDLRKQNNYVCMYEAGLGRGVNEQATFTCGAQNSPLWSFPTSSTHADQVYETRHSPMTRFFRCGGLCGFLFT